ncbi:unnamed protein product [Coffea canephora]|uniref:RING-type domain-containing protein n=1 Tax=Coffea canephora TaxID=49390 RepID=A0A068UIS6_COFCA|nr:unnamed protein product [Coffea canephora]
MACSLTELPPPLSCISLVAIIIVYLIICYLVIDLTHPNDDRSGEKDCRGLSAEELQKAACFYYHKVGSESTCAICLDSIQNAQLCRAFPPCSHVFHVQCIDPWLTKNMTCPSCRSLYEVQQRFCS